MTALLLIMALAAQPGTSYPDTLEITGVFAGYSMGDYYYAVFLKEDGSIIDTAFPPGGSTPGLDVFLFMHRWEEVTVLAENRQFDLYEAGHQIVPVIVDAHAGEDSYTDWFRAVRDETGISTAQEFHEAFGNLMDTEPLFDESSPYCLPHGEN
jgi:hypothetical protein